MLLNGGQVLTERAKISGQMEAWIDIDTGERWTFHDGNLRTNQLAHVLLARKLLPGDRVGVLMGNTPRHAMAYFACAKAGFVFVALNWRLTVPELSYQLTDSGASAVLYDAELEHLVGPLREQFPRIRWIDVGAAETEAEVTAASTHEPPIGATLEDALFMMYTSGTTGRPKGALMSHRANIAWLNSMMATSDVRVGDRQITVAPLFHIAGLGMTMAAAFRGMTHGAGAAVRARPDVGRHREGADQRPVLGARDAELHARASEAPDRGHLDAALDRLWRGPGAGGADRGLRRDGHRDPPGLRGDGDPRRHLPDRAGARTRQGRLDRACPTSASTCGSWTWPATTSSPACRAR